MSLSLVGGARVVRGGLPCHSGVRVLLPQLTASALGMDSAMLVNNPRITCRFRTVELFLSLLQLTSKAIRGT